MKKNRVKKYIIGIVIVVFLFINVLWYIGMFREYAILQSRMKKNPNYIDEGILDIGEGILDEDGYSYFVHFPTYLYWRNGNLSITSPLEEIGKFPEDSEKSIYAANGGSLIIWLKHFSGEIDEIGVTLEKDGVKRQIYLIDNETAAYADDQPYVDAGQSEIDKLFRKAEDVWDIEMPWKK